MGSTLSIPYDTDMKQAVQDAVEGKDKLRNAKKMEDAATFYVDVLGPDPYHGKGFYVDHYAAMLREKQGRLVYRSVFLTGEIASDGSVAFRSDETYE